MSPFNAVAIMILNGAEIVYIIRTRRRNGYPTVSSFLLNLATSDFLVGLSIGVIKVLYATGANSTFIDLLHFYFLRLSLFASVSNLTCMTFFRLFAIQKPFQAHLVKKHVIKICIATWVVSIAVVSLFYYSMKYSLRGISFNRYEVIIFPVIVYPAVVFFFVSYFKIIKKLAQQNTKLSESRHRAEAKMIDTNPLADFGEPYRNAEPECNKGLQNESIITENNSRRVSQYAETTTIQESNGIECLVSANQTFLKIKVNIKIDRKRQNNGSNRYEKQIFQIALRSVIAFVLCWFPIATYSIFKTMGLFSNSSRIKEIEYFLLTLAFWNSIADPVLFFISTRKKLSKITSKYRHQTIEK